VLEKEAAHAQNAQHSVHFYEYLGVHSAVVPLRPFQAEQHQPSHMLSSKNVFRARFFGRLGLNNKIIPVHGKDMPRHLPIGIQF
jgi:hypothetical protein